jgi:hypothetical protein
MLWSLVEVNQCLCEMYCLHPHNRGLSQASSKHHDCFLLAWLSLPLQPWRRRRYVPLKCRKTSTTVCGHHTHKPVLFAITAARTTDYKSTLQLKTRNVKTCKISIPLSSLFICPMIHAFPHSLYAEHSSVYEWNIYIHIKHKKTFTATQFLWMNSYWITAQSIDSQSDVHQEWLWVDLGRLMGDEKSYTPKGKGY